MNVRGVLLDTGPLVALLSKNDAAHARAERLFSDCQPPLRTTEAVVAEACFLMQKVHPRATAEVVRLGHKGVYEMSISVPDHWSRIETLLEKYANRRISLADACLILCAETLKEPRILTFDSDFKVYRWARNRRFEILNG